MPPCWHRSVDTQSMKTPTTLLEAVTFFSDPERGLGLRRQEPLAERRCLPPPWLRVRFRPGHRHAQEVALQGLQAAVFRPG